MKIAVITDAHANLPALEAALTSIRAEGCEAIFHTGDSIAIGPYPAECLDLLLNTPNVQFVLGNHESYFVEGLPTPQPAWMSDGEVDHHRWTHSRLDAQLRPVLAEWPTVTERNFEGVQATFVHYGLGPSGQGFQPVIRDPTPEDLDGMFASQDTDLVFYGHHHPRSDVEGRARYVNPGSLGCSGQPIARYCIAEFRRGQYTIAHRAVGYEDGELYQAFERRGVPKRAFIYRVFFGGRFG